MAIYDNGVFNLSYDYIFWIIKLKTAVWILKQMATAPAVDSFMMNDTVSSVVDDFSDVELC